MFNANDYRREIRGNTHVLVSICEIHFRVVRTVDFANLLSLAVCVPVHSHGLPLDYVMTI